MAIVTQTKKEVCRYSEYEYYSKTLAFFGWAITEKHLLNKFKNPVALGETISEADKREKCFYEISLKRTVDENKIYQLDKLFAEYDACKPQPAAFSGGRITAMVFVSLPLFGFLIAALSSISHSIALFITFFLLAIFLPMAGLAGLIVSGVFGVARILRENNKKEQRRKDILRLVQELLQDK